MSKQYDKVPEEWFGDVKRIWQAQITGQKKFETYAFMGCLNDLQGDPNWRDAFKGIETCTGMPEFMDRLQGHFDLCKPAVDSDGRMSLYQHPSRTTGENMPDGAAMVSIAKRHIDTLMKALKLSDMEDVASELAQYPVVWTDKPLAYFSLDRKAQKDATDVPIELDLFDAWEFAYDLNDKEGVPHILEDLKESAYSLANDFDLRRYLMQSFIAHDLDVDAIYELEWVNNCFFYFYETNCYVAKNPR